MKRICYATLMLIFISSTHANDKLGKFCLKDSTGKDKCGYIDSEANVVIPPQFDEVGSFQANGLANVTQNNKQGLINISGEWVAKPQFEEIGKFALILDGYFASAKQNNKWGILNSEGEWIIKPQFEEIRKFSLILGDYVSEAKKNNKWGILNSEGEWIIKPQFASLKIGHKNDRGLTDAISGVPKNTVRVKKGNKEGLINFQGEWILKPQYQDIRKISHEFVEVDDGSQHSIVNIKTGATILSQFDSIALFSTTGLIAKQNNKYGIMTEQGEWAVKPILDEIGKLSANGLAKVMKNSKYGYINQKGEWVIEPQFDGASNFSDNLAAAKNESGKWGYINGKGNWVIKPQFDSAHDFSNDLAAAKNVNGKWGYINDKGNWVIKPQFKSAGSFADNGLVAPVMSDGKWGYIDHNGEWKLPPQFDATAYISNSLFGEVKLDDLVLVKQDGKWGIINTNSQWIITPEFTNIFRLDFIFQSSIDDDNVVFGTMKGELLTNPPNFVKDKDIATAQSKTNGKWGIIKKEGSWAINPQFDSMGILTRNGLVRAEKDNKSGFINMKGEWVAIIIDTVCGAQRLKKPNGELIYPKKSVLELCK